MSDAFDKAASWLVGFLRDHVVLKDDTLRNDLVDAWKRLTGAEDPSPEPDPTPEPAPVPTDPTEPVVPVAPPDVPVQTAPPGVEDSGSAPAA